jgi:hypothetical protein
MVDVAGHVIIQRSYQMIGHLHDCYGKACFGEILCHFQTDGTAAHDDRPPGMLGVDEGPNRQCVGDGAQRKNAGILRAGKIGPDRFSAGREDQFVIALFIGIPITATNGDRFRVGMNGYGFMAHANFHVKAAIETLGCLQRQIFLIGDLAAHIVG